MKLPCQCSHFLSLIAIIFLCNISECSMVDDILQYVQSMTYKGYTAIKCRIKVCCNEERISNIAGLETDLVTKVHGQHLVLKTVVGHIKGHLRTKNPPKALVLSFHGPTGVGKNYVSRLIAENLYKNGLHSKFVHLISATKEFPHEGMVAFYKDQLKGWIEGNVTLCDKSMFIFDEIDKMPTLLLDVIKPYLEYYHNLGGVDYRHSIFIFLSNTGSSAITERMLEHWKSGKQRDLLTLKDVEQDLMLAAVNDKNQAGLWHSRVISNNLVTAFIPFLPLEKTHIRQCIHDILVHQDYFSQDSVPKDVIDLILEEMTFTPSVEQLYSSTGCKRVAEKVNYVMLNRQPSVKDEL